MAQVPVVARPAVPAVFAPSSWAVDGALFAAGSGLAVVAVDLWRAVGWLSAADWVQFGGMILWGSLVGVASWVALGVAAGGLAALVLRALRGRVLPTTGLTLAALAAAAPVLAWSWVTAGSAGAMITAPLVALAVLPVLPWLAVRRGSGTASPLGTVTGGAVWVLALQAIAKLVWALL